MIFRPQRHVFMAAATAALVLSGRAALADTAPNPAAATPGPVELPPPPPGKGQVVFYRKPLFSLVPFNWIAREGKTEICEMEAGTYCIAPADPGVHTYEVHSEVKNDLTLEVDAGETYYVIGGISMGLIVNHPNISPAEKAQFDSISAKLKSIPPIAAAAPTAVGPAPSTPGAPPAAPSSAPAVPSAAPAAPSAAPSAPGSGPTAPPAT